MWLKLSKPIIVFDLETTGLIVGRDRIIELSYIKVMPDGAETRETLRFNPEMPIPAESSAVHGLYDADVADCPTFAEQAPRLAQVFKGCDLAGFNSNHFDVPMLVEEMYRVGITMDLAGVRLVDVQNIFHKMEPRNLVAAYKFYCGQSLENAHSAMADTEATYEVLKAQLARYEGEIPDNVAGLSEFSKMNRNADLAGRMVYDADDEIVFNFGKYKGRRVTDVFVFDPAYYPWMMQGDFPQNTKALLTRIKLGAFPKKK